jgi:hypothetical protein
MAAATPHGVTAADDKEKPGHEGEYIRVTVVVVLGSTKHERVDKKLADFVKQMAEIDQTLTGFVIHEVLQQSIEAGKSHDFELLDEHTLTVGIDKSIGDGKRVGLSVQMKDGQKVSYTCTCNKYFPMMTHLKTKDEERVIVAIMAKPCTGQGP